MEKKVQKEESRNVAPKKQKKPHRKDLTHRPPRAPTALDFFAKEYNHEDNNDTPVEAAWKALSDAEKEPYLVMAGKAAATELTQKWEIEFGKGYFLLEDGTKSTDEKNKTLSG